MTGGAQSGRWRTDARLLHVAKEINAYYEAQRRAARFRTPGNRAEYWHSAKVAAEVVRLSPHVEMDIDVVRRIVSEEERWRG